MSYMSCDQSLSKLQNSDILHETIINTCSIYIGHYRGLHVIMALCNCANQTHILHRVPVSDDENAKYSAYAFSSAYTSNILFLIALKFMSSIKSHLMFLGP